MRNRAELIEDVKTAIADEDLSEVADIVCELLGHLSEFSHRTGETWDREDVRDCCHDIGDMLDEAGGMEAMQDVYYYVLDEMRGIAARTLEYFWNGCGDWRS